MAMNAHKMIKLTAMGASYLILALIFHLHGNALFVAESGRSIFYWLYRAWFLSNAEAIDSSHGPLIIIASAILLWKDRKAVAKAVGEVYLPAGAAIVLGIVMHWCGLRAQQTFLSLLAMPLLIWAIPSCIYGKKVSELIRFPCAYLLFAVPWNVLAGFSFYLRLISASASAIILNGIAIPVHREGTGLFVGLPDPVPLDVAAPCSGLHSLTALCALTVLYAYMTSTSTSRKAVIAFSSIPIALVSNIIRIVSLSIAALFFRQEKAMAFYHDASGYLVFIPAVLLTMLAARLTVRAGTRSQESSQEHQ